jgi:hypothetical protein
MRFLFSIISALFFCLALPAQERLPYTEGFGFYIMIDNDVISFSPDNSDLRSKPNEGPYFIQIDFADTIEGLLDESKVNSIIQGIPLSIETPYPIVLNMAKN